ncbi:MAG: ATP-binding protein [Methanomassiliicoccaceae archaeon]|nr:ATP-binding protein [Methanomassiliicoccaceae archaeon]
MSTKKVIIRRDQLDRLIRMKDKRDIIKVLTGIRRSGKSTILSQFSDHLLSSGVPAENVVSINFESMAYSKIRCAADLYEFLEKKISSKGTTYFLLDEIQHVKEWEKAVNSLRIDHDADICITGSNSSILSSSLTRDLTGRFFEIPVYPMTLREFMELNETDDAHAALNDYSRRGGLPVINSSYTDEDAGNMLSGIYSSILFNDIIGMNDIRDPALLENMVRFLLDNIGNNVTAASISKYTGKDPNMVSRYLKAVTNSYLFYKAESYDLKGRKLLKTQAKYYCTDIGIRNVIAGEQYLDKGRVMENTVFMELLRTGYKVRTGRYDDLEIDFTATKDGKRTYIQVTYTIEEEHNLKRELRPFKGPKDHYRRILVTGDLTGRSSQDGIEVISLGDFLLNGI